MKSVKSLLRQMASTPKKQLKQLLIGTAGAFVCMLGLVLTSQFESEWLFYCLSFVLVLFFLYAIPGYIGIWVWRMKNLIFKD